MVDDRGIRRWMREQPEEVRRRESGLFVPKADLEDLSDEIRQEEIAAKRRWVPGRWGVLGVVERVGEQAAGHPAREREGDGLLRPLEVDSCDRNGMKNVRDHGSNRRNGFQMRRRTDDVGSDLRVV